MNTKKEVFRRINKQLQESEKKNGGPLNRNIDFQLKLIATELGKANENLMKASLHQRDKEKFEAYFVGFKNNLAKLGARVVQALDYMERNFEPDGRSKDMGGENKE